MSTYLLFFIELFVMRRGAAGRQRGATLIEYALIVAVIAIAVLVGGLALSGSLNNFFNTVGADITNPESS